MSWRRELEKGNVHFIILHPFQTSIQCKVVKMHDVMHFMQSLVKDLAQQSLKFSSNFSFILRFI